MPPIQAQHPTARPAKTREFVPSMGKPAAGGVSPTTLRDDAAVGNSTSNVFSWASTPDLDGSADAGLGMAGNPWHNPQLHQVVDLLQVAIMSSRNGWRLSEDNDKRPSRRFHKHGGYGRCSGIVNNPEHVSAPFRTPLPDEYRGLVSRLVEAVPLLERQIQMAEARAGRVAEERLHDLALYEAAVDEWNQREDGFKSEMRRLELLLAHETKGGMETVALARSTSVVNRGDSHRFKGRMRMVGERVRESLGGSDVDNPEFLDDERWIHKDAVGKTPAVGPTRLNQQYLGDRRKIVDEDHDVRVSRSLLTGPKVPLPTPNYGRVRDTRDYTQSPVKGMANMDELPGLSRPTPSDPDHQGHVHVGHERLGKQSSRWNSSRPLPDSGESDSSDESSSSDDEGTAQDLTEENRGEGGEGLQRVDTMTQEKYNSDMYAHQNRQLGRELGGIDQQKKRFSFEPGEDQIRLSPTPLDSVDSANPPIESAPTGSGSTAGAMPTMGISAKQGASPVPGCGWGTRPFHSDGSSTAIGGSTRASPTTIRYISSVSCQQGAAAVTNVGSGESSVDGALDQPGASNCRDVASLGVKCRKAQGEVRGQLEDGGDYFGCYQSPSPSTVVPRILAPENPSRVTETATAPSIAATTVADGLTTIQEKTPPPKKAKRSKAGGNAKRSQPPPPPLSPWGQTTATDALDGGGAGAGVGAGADAGTGAGAGASTGAGAGTGADTGTGTGTGATTIISAAAAAAAAATRGLASASARAATGVLFSAAPRKVATSESDGGDTSRGELAGKVP
ncbi:hypothetical protein RB598_004060 [Gaeumannomyces tritici]